MNHNNRKIKLPSGKHIRRLGKRRHGTGHEAGVEIVGSDRVYVVTPSGAWRVLKYAKEAVK
jgi:hypothetical protein